MEAGNPEPHPATRNPELETAFIALGSNLDDPCNQIRRAFCELAALPHSRLSARSSLYRSAPVGYLDQPDFINAVARIETALPPGELLEALLAIERRCKRLRRFANAPRTLDLDLLLYGDLAFHREGLTVPHPRMGTRAFVLAPLVEIAPACVIPGLGAAQDLLAGLSGQALEKLGQ